jgi:hypothetical protein
MADCRPLPASLPGLPWALGVLRIARRLAQRGIMHLVLLAALWAGAAAGADLEVRSASIASGDDGYVLNADFAIELSQRLEDIIAHGVPLFFVVEVELTRARWYWFDEEAVAKSRTFRVYYHALTRQYRVSFGALHQNFASLADALRTLEHIREWQIADKGALTPGQVYRAGVRMRLDLTQLPKPLQVTAFGSKDWSLGTDWFSFDFTPPGAETK